MTLGIRALAFPVVSQVRSSGGSESLQALVASSLYFLGFFMHSLGDVRHPGAIAFPVSQVRSSGGSESLQASVIPVSIYLGFLMHSLGDVRHPGAGLPCLAGSEFRRFRESAGLRDW